VADFESSVGTFAPRRAHRLLLLVPLALLLFAAGVLRWTSLRCPALDDSLAAVLVAAAATLDALVLAVVFLWRRFDAPWHAAVVAAAVLGATFVVGGLGIPGLVNGLDRRSQMRTMGDMRTIATAIESRALERREHAVARPDDIDALARELEPTYVKALPRLDGWGNPIHFESDGRSYTITSYGCCGEPDGADIHVAPNGGTTTFSADIVFTNGSFVKFPDGTQL